MDISFYSSSLCRFCIALWQNLMSVLLCFNIQTNKIKPVSQFVCANSCSLCVGVQHSQNTENNVADTDYLKLHLH